MHSSSFRFRFKRGLDLRSVRYLEQNYVCFCEWKIVHKLEVIILLMLNRTQSLLFTLLSLTHTNLLFHSDRTGC